MKDEPSTPGHSAGAPPPPEAPVEGADTAAEPILTTPLVERAVELLRECAAARAIGVLAGDNGTGKTWALNALLGRYAGLGLPGRAHLHRCCQLPRGASRGVRDILAALGCRGAIFQNGSGASLQFLARFALREFRKREIRALLLDEADTWSEETLGGVVTLFDLCREEGSPLTLILVGVNDPEQWMGGVGSGRSRTLRVEAARALDGPTMLGVMAAWAPGPLRPLAERVGAGDKEARRLLRLLHRGLGGNLRRARFFCDLLPLVHMGEGDGQGELTEALMNRVLARMTLPGPVGPAPAARR